MAEPKNVRFCPCDGMVETAPREVQKPVARQDATVSAQRTLTYFGRPLKTRDGLYISQASLTLAANPPGSFPRGLGGQFHTCRQRVVNVG